MYHLKIFASNFICICLIKFSYVIYVCSAALSKACLLEVAWSRILFDPITIRVSYLFVVWLGGFILFTTIVITSFWLSSVAHTLFMFLLFCLLLYTFSFHYLFFCFSLFPFFNDFEGVYFVLNSTCGHLLLFRVTF